MTSGLTSGRRGLAAAALLALLAIAYLALAGALRQLGRPLTLGQCIETGMQLASGILALLVMLTPWRGRRLRWPIRAAWAITLAAAAGLSSLVWGPPMPLTAVAFAGIALGAAALVVWALEVATR